MQKWTAITAIIIITVFVEWLIYQLLAPRFNFFTTLVFLAGPVIIAIITSFVYFRVYWHDDGDDEDVVLTLDQFPKQEEDEVDEAEEEQDERIVCIVISASTKGKLQDGINNWLEEGYRIHHVLSGNDQKGPYVLIFYWKPV